MRKNENSAVATATCARMLWSERSRRLFAKLRAARPRVSARRYGKIAAYTLGKSVCAPLERVRECSLPRPFRRFVMGEHIMANAIRRRDRFRGTLDPRARERHAHFTAARIEHDFEPALASGTKRRAERRNAGARNRRDVFRRQQHPARAVRGELQERLRKERAERSVEVADEIDDDGSGECRSVRID